MGIRKHSPWQVRSEFYPQMQSLTLYLKPYAPRRLVNHLGQTTFHWPQGYLSRFDCRKIQQVLNNVHQGLSRCLYRLQMLTLLITQLRTQHHVREAQDAIEGRPHLMRNICQNFVLKLACRFRLFSLLFQLPCALAYRRFQLALPL